jgi:hypothetical protein
MRLSVTTRLLRLSATYFSSGTAPHKVYFPGLTVVYEGASSELSRFGKLCRNEVVQMTFDDYKKEETVHEDKIVEVKMSRDNESISALILPPGQIWPSFMDLIKQKSRCGQRVLFKRTSALYSNILTKTVDTLSAKKSCVWLGHPGIGKSVSSSLVLMELIKQLGEDDSNRYSIVCHRINGLLFEYRLTDDGKVQCSEGMRCRTLADLNDYCHDKHKDATRVMVLEMAENESDPNPICVPTMVPLSCRRNQDQFKMLSKSAGTMVQIIGPHTPAEMEMMAQLLYHVDLEGVKVAESVSVLNEVFYLRMIKRRVTEIGPLAREVFFKDDYDRFLGERPSHRHQFLPEATKFTSTSVPEGSMFFVAPHPTLEISPFTQGPWDVQFLSRSATEIIARSMISKDDFKRLQYTGLGTTIMKEVLLRYGLQYSSELSSESSKESIPEGWKSKMWHVHNDPGFGQTLSALTVAALKPSELLPTCKHRELFDEQHFAFDAGKLRNNTLYQSKSSTVSPLGELFTFHIDKSGEKWVTFFLISTKLPDVYPISFDSLEKRFDGLGLFANHNSLIGVRIIYVVDSNEYTVHGMKFTHRELAYTLATMRKYKAMEKIASRMETYIIRAGISASSGTRATSLMDLTRCSHVVNCCH